MRSSFFSFLLQTFHMFSCFHDVLWIIIRTQETNSKVVTYHDSRSISACIVNLIIVPFFRPLFSSGFLRTVQALLEQTRQVEMQIIGCQSLFEFVNVSFLHT